jgi:hypothetical protein
MRNQPAVQGAIVRRAIAPIGPADSCVGPDARRNAARAALRPTGPHPWRCCACAAGGADLQVLLVHVCGRGLDGGTENGLS